MRLANSQPGSAAGGARWGVAAALAGPRAAVGWPLVALVALSGALLLGAYQVERPFAVDVGGAHETPFVRNFHPKALDEGDRTSYRWTDATSFLLLGGIGGGRERQVTLRLSSGRAPGLAHPVSVLVNGVELARPRVGAEWQTVRLDLRGAAAGAHGVVVELRTPVERLAQVGNQPVGVRVDRLELATTGGRTVPAWDTFALALAAPPLLYAIALRALGLAGAGTGARRRVPAALVGAAGALALAGIFALARPFVAASVVPLLGVLLGVLVATLLPGPLTRLGARLGLATTRREATALCAILALGIAVKLGGLLYPDTVVVDLAWHVKWQRVLLAGDFAQLYFPSDLSSGPREWGAGVRIPKSPLYYVAMAPATALPLAIGTALKLAAGLLELALPFVAYALLKGLGQGAAGVFAALLYTVTPLSYLLLSYGSYPTLFAQFLTILTFALLLRAGERLRRPAAFAAFVAILALSLLAYPVVAVFNVCVLVAFGLWRWRGAADARAARLALLPPAGAALAALLAFAAYYAQHVGVALASARTLGGETAQARGNLDGGLLGAPAHIATVFARNILTGKLLLLLPLALVGLALLRRAAAGDAGRRTWQLLAVWLAILPAFIVVDAYVELLLKPLFYTMFPVAILGGVALAWLWRRGRVGRLLAALCCAAIAAQAWWLWLQRIATAGQTLE